MLTAEMLKPPIPELRFACKARLVFGFGVPTEVSAYQPQRLGPSESPRRPIDFSQVICWVNLTSKARY